MYGINSYMTQKLFAYAKDKCCSESPDNPMFQEALLVGHLYQTMLTVGRSNKTVFYFGFCKFTKKLLSLILLFSFFC